MTSSSDQIRLRYSSVDGGKYLEVRGEALVVLDEAGDELAVFEATRFGRIERVPFPRFVVSFYNTRLADRSFEFHPRNGWGPLQKALLMQGWKGNLDFFGPGMTFRTETTARP